MTPWRAFAIGLTLALPGFAACAEAITPAAAFEKLGSLVGDWEAKTEKGAVIRTNYRLVSADTETYFAEGKDDTDVLKFARVH